MLLESVPRGESVSRAAEVELELQAFSYIVSHDLAASFRHVSEFSRLLLGELGEDLTGPQQSHADRIRVATDKCRIMMERLLAFSRVQQEPLILAPRDATQAMKAALDDVPVFASGDAEVIIRPLGKVHADAGLLAVVFRELLDNAIKFRRPDVRPRVVVHAAHDLTTCRIRLTDNGPGVEAPYREKAFGMFRRLNGEDAYSGVGAGLAISRRIARRHDGEVRFLDCTTGASVELALPRAGTFH